MFSKSLAVIALTFLATLSGCTVQETAGSGVAKSEERSIAAYSQIETKGINVRVVVDPAATGTTATVSGDDNLVAVTRTYVDKNRLIVELDHEDREVDTQVPLEVVLRTPHLGEVEAMRGARVDLTLMTKLPLNVKASSGAHVRARGEVSQLNVELNGGSELNARELKAWNAELEANGSSNASVCVTGELDIDLHGSSKATYRCNPADIDRDIDHSSHLTEE